MCMYVTEICAEGIFVTFPWWLKYVRSRSKIALFSNERHFEIWFPKKRTIAFFWSKLSKLHKKDPILHVATTFSLKQGETRTSHGPIPHPLTHSSTFKRCCDPIAGPSSDCADDCGSVWSCDMRWGSCFNIGSQACESRKQMQPFLLSDSFSTCSQIASFTPLSNHFSSLSRMIMSLLLNWWPELLTQ